MRRFLSNLFTAFLLEKNNLIATICRFSTFDNIPTLRSLQIVTFLVCQPTGIESQPGLPNVTFVCLH